MKKQLTNSAMRVLGLAAAMTVTFALVNEADAGTRHWVPGGDTNNPNEYANDLNWSDGQYPGGGSEGEQVLIVGTDGDRSEISSDLSGNVPDAAYFWVGLNADGKAVQGSGQLDILGSGYLSLSGTQAKIGEAVDGNATGTINLKGGTYEHGGNSASGHRIILGAGGNGNTGTGIINVESGTFDAGRNLSIGGYADSTSGSLGHGELNISGGTVDLDGGTTYVSNDYNDNDNTSGIFHVEGAGATRIHGARDMEFKNAGTLKLGFDNSTDGVQKIEVNNTDENGSGDVRFESGSTLDLYFTGDPLYNQTWEVMSWVGNLEDLSGTDLFGAADTLTMDDVPLAFADGVAAEDWDVNFYKNEVVSGGYMTVTAVPEPGSLALLLFGAALLFTGRRRRRK